jgi:hypothetical protein
MSIRHTTRLFSSHLRPQLRLAQLKSHTLVSHINPLNSRIMASLPSTMKGVLIEKTGGVEVLQYKTDLPLPVPKDGELLVKNDFIGINYIDTYCDLPLPSLSDL